MTSLRTIGRIIGWLGVASIALIAIDAFLFWLIVPDMSGMCGNTVISELPSPDGTKKLVVFERNCGATTDFSTQVSIFPADTSLPNESGNLFISDTNHGAAPAGPGGGPLITATWDNAQSVVLTHDSKVRVSKAESHVAGVKVRYVTAP